ncbi:peptidase [Paenibacillus sp. JX-17]|uniref:Peptidase n=1 Tax=Paenibacillus lacisoli TaxID=3064525 RepID=A0ABT9CDY2_9BACL|nr:peptidase [Paenibacillus sp. JX-17]MDO7905803.1 peptidase [Paenibacillus sp. JX-17]
MIKNRTFILGIGIGLILGALLLQLAIIGKGEEATPASSSTGELTREELEAAAKQLNLKVTDSSEQLMTEEQWREKVISDNKKAAVQSSKAPAAAEKPAEPAAPKTPEAKSSTQAQTAAPQNPSKPVTTQPETPQVNYKISSGSNLNSVAQGLKEAGVIRDAAAFRSRASELKINRKIQSGTFTFNKGESFDSIINKITIKPSS